MPITLGGKARHLFIAGLALGLSQSAACSGRLHPVSRPATSSPAHPAGNRTATSQRNTPVHPDAKPPARLTTSSPAARGGSGVKLRQVDGGRHYYANFSHSLPDTRSFFPIGVWLAAVNQPSDLASDRATGINTYVTLTNNSDFALVRRSSMHFISNQPPNGGSNTVGWFVNDEADMWGGPGSGAWTGKYPGQGDICHPASVACGYTVQKSIIQKLPSDRRFKYANYGKGVTFWETNAEAVPFVRRYQDVASADNYWFTDDSICAANQGGEWFAQKLLVGGNLPSRLCHLAANYDRTVHRLRNLAVDRKPVWAYVELGHPFTENNWPSITPRQVAAAVWQSLIAGARGIIYFNHSFAGPCITDNVLRDPCYAKIRAKVTKLDRQVARLAPVLNAPYADGAVKASSGVNVSTKWYRGHFYVLAGSKRPGAQSATFSMPCVGSAIVNVLHERRSLKASNGSFTDRFSDGNAIHIYRVDSGSSCGAY